MRASITTVPVQKFTGSGRQTAEIFEASLDLVSVEEPLQIRVTDGEGTHDVAITMRTPGHDHELAAGFLFSEGIVQKAQQIQSITPDDRGSIDLVLEKSVTCELGQRNFYMTSSCGVCGKASIDALRQSGASMIHSDVRAEKAVLLSLPGKLRESQAAFEQTGGLHAAGLFSSKGELISLREDVGRHNAVDKLIGQALLAGRLPLSEIILMLSGRISFELVQKAVMAGIPIIAAVGAPSSLAVETARRFGITLIGFLRDQRCNVYAGAERLLA